MYRSRGARLDRTVAVKICRIVSLTGRVSCGTSWEDYKIVADAPCSVLTVGTFIDDQKTLAQRVVYWIAWGGCILEASLYSLATSSTASFERSLSLVDSQINSIHKSLFRVLFI